MQQRAKSQHARRAMKYALAVALFAAAGLASAQSPCAPPDSMKDRFIGKPNVEALNELGYWFAEQKNYDCAVQAFASSLQLDSQQKQFPLIAFMLGINLYLSGDVKEAIPALQEAEKFGYGDIKIHLLLAQALEDTQATADSEAEWRAALEIDPEHFVALDHLSSDLLADKNDKAVIELLDTPRIAPLRTIQQAANLGTAYTRVGALDEAARILSDGLNTYPDSMPLAQQLAEVLTRQGKPAAADAVLRIARDRQANPSQGSR